MKVVLLRVRPPQRRGPAGMRCTKNMICRRDVVVTHVLNGLGESLHGLGTGVDLGRREKDTYLIARSSKTSPAPSG